MELMAELVAIGRYRAEHQELYDWPEEAYDVRWDSGKIGHSYLRHGLMPEREAK